jgi:hypothetical protein
MHCFLRLDRMSGSLRNKISFEDTHRQKCLGRIHAKHPENDVVVVLTKIQN